jgi:hypothetical protein
VCLCVQAGTGGRRGSDGGEQEEGRGEGRGVIARCGAGRRMDGGDEEIYLGPLVAGEGMGAGEVRREAELGDAGLWGVRRVGGGCTGIGCGAWRDGGASAANLADIVSGIMGGSGIGGRGCHGCWGLESREDGARRC